MQQVRAAGRLANLPVRRTALIGRDHDLAAVCGLVLHSAGRLVTITGVAAVCHELRSPWRHPTPDASGVHQQEHR